MSGNTGRPAPPRPLLPSLPPPFRSAARPGGAAARSARAAMIVAPLLLLSAIQLWLHCSTGTCAAELLELYQGVVRLAGDQGVPLPSGAAVSGHVAPAGSAAAEGLAFVEEGDEAALCRVSCAAAARSTVNDRLLRSIRMKDANLMITDVAADGGLDAVRFAARQLARCNGISGTDTRLLVRCEGDELAGAFAALRDVRWADPPAAPSVGLLLPPDPALWLAALRLRAAAGEEDAPGGP